MHRCIFFAFELSRHFFLCSQWMTHPWHTIVPHYPPCLHIVKPHRWTSLDTELRLPILQGWIVLLCKCLKLHLETDLFCVPWHYWNDHVYLGTDYLGTPMIILELSILQHQWITLERPWLLWKWLLWKSHDYFVNTFSPAPNSTDAPLWKHLN